MAPPSNAFQSLAGPAAHALAAALADAQATLAFLVVGLTGALLVSVFVGLGTQRAFNQFVSDRDARPRWSTAGAAITSNNGSWNGVSTMLDRAHAQHGRADGWQRTAAGAAATSTAVDHRGDRPNRVGHAAAVFDRDKGAPITVNSTSGRLADQPSRRIEPAGADSHPSRISVDRDHPGDHV